jgi:hypothetical protein
MLRFQQEHCNCEYSCVNCSFVGGKYDNEYENCIYMITCGYCDNYFCNEHICLTCEFCDKCAKHEKCKYCDFSICPKDMDINSPPDITEYTPGNCKCGEELEEITTYHCSKCLDPEIFYQRSHVKMYHKCQTCDTVGVNYSRSFYRCQACYYKNQVAIIPDCDNCGLKRHFGCKDFGLCACEGKLLCPGCVTNCKKCNTPLCTYCSKNSYCPICDENSDID